MSNVYLPREFLRAVAASPTVQQALQRKAQVGMAAFRAAAPKRTGRFADNVRIEDMRSPKGTPGKRIVAYADPRGSKDPNAPIPIEFGARGHQGAHAMQAARAAMER